MFLGFRSRLVNLPVRQFVTQLLAQRAHPAVRVDPDRRRRAAEQLRDLGVRQVLAVPQHEHDPLPGRQRGQRLADQQAEHVTFSEVLGAVAAA